MRRAATTILFALALAAAADGVVAARLYPVGLNESRRVVLHGSVANVIVANPAVADVALVDAHSLIILGRGYGATDIMALDHAGRVLFDGQVRVSPQEDGLVTLHRGGATDDIYCLASRCAPLVAGGVPVSAYPGANSGGSGAAATPSPGASAAPVTPPGG